MENKKKTTTTSNKNKKNKQTRKKGLFLLDGLPIRACAKCYAGITKKFQLHQTSTLRHTISVISLFKLSLPSPMDFFFLCNVESEKYWTLWRPNFGFPVWQTVRRITNEILGVKGLKPVFVCFLLTENKRKTGCCLCRCIFFRKK